jgi:hypothetical protein
MTRPLEERRLVWELHGQGLNHCQIARASGIPRSTLREWLQAPERALPAGPSCERCGHDPHDFDALPGADYAYLFGLYLGDGCISSQRKRIYRLRISMDARYPGIIAECARAMRAVLLASAVNVQYHQTARLAEIGSSSRAWPCYFPQHGPGRKHLRRIALEPWQEAIVDRETEAFLRGLVHSDGCRCINRVSGEYYYPRYLFSQVSEDIRALFCAACDRLGIEYRLNRWNSVSIARRASVARLDEFIGPKQ